jgi:hypothetical protein
VEQIRNAAAADVAAMAALAVVVTGHLDQPKREMLRECGLELASEWWVTPIGASERHGVGTVSSGG